MVGGREEEESVVTTRTSFFIRLQPISRLVLIAAQDKLFRVRLPLLSESARALLTTMPT